MQQATPFPGNPDDLTDHFLNSYVEKFLDIADFKTIENGKGLLDMFRQYPDHPKLKPAIRKVVGLYGCDAPAGKVCALQFLKQALECGSFFTLECIEKSVLIHFAQIIEYRSSVKSIQRGTTYFIREFDKNMGDDEMMNLVKLSSTFFRMVHECLYVWGALYFPGSAFDKLRQKLEKKVSFPEFPRDFKFFSETKVNNFKEKCQELIKRVEERALTAEANSIISKKSQSMNKDRNTSNSPRSIKKTKQIQKAQPQQHQKQATVNPVKEIRKMYDQEAMEQRELQKIQQEILEVPPSSKRTKRHKSKRAKQQKKAFIQQRIKEQSSVKSIQNNSSKMRKKNSFVEVPFDLERHNSNQEARQSSSQLNKLEQAKSRDPSKGETMIKTIQQNEQSDGGRYSVQETLSKESEISEIMYEYNRDVSSPRSQYSQANKQNRQFNFKRQNSDQLPPSITVRGKQLKNQFKAVIKQDEMHTNKPTSQTQKRTATAQNKADQVQRKQQHSFKLPLNQIKAKLQVSPPKSSKPQNYEIKNDKEKERKGKKGELTARKKFVSSEEQSVKQIKQQLKIPQKIASIATISKHFNDNSSVDYQNESNKNKKMQQFKQVIPILKNQQVHEAMPLPPNQKQAFQSHSSKETPQAMPVKASKPMKLKSNSNLKTVFESADYKIVDHAVKKDEQHSNKQFYKEGGQHKQKKQNSVNKSEKNIPKQSKIPNFSKQLKKGSIFEVVQVDTIETINQLTPAVYRPDARHSSPAIPPRTRQQQQTSLKTATRKEKSTQQLKFERESTKKEGKQPNARQQRSVSLQDNSINGVAESDHKPNHRHLPIEQAKHQYINQDRRSTTIQPGQDHRSIKSVRQNSIYSSRFRQFKQVNLFIEPKVGVIPHSPSAPQKITKQLVPVPAHEDSFNSEFKQQIMEELYKIKSSFLQKEETLNQTLMSLKSERVAQRKQSDDDKIETGTQTKLRHKSKTKFQRKNKYKLFDESQSQENISTINMPNEKPAETIPTKLNSLQTIAPKKVEVSTHIQRKKSGNEKEQLKPNTLLYALYKRKYSNQ